MGDDACTVHFDDEVVAEPADFAGWYELDHTLVGAAVHFEADGVALFEAAFAGYEADEEGYALDFGGRLRRVIAGGHQASAFVPPGELLHIVAEGLPGLGGCYVGHILFFRGDFFWGGCDGGEEELLAAGWAGDSGGCSDGITTYGTAIWTGCGGEVEEVEEGASDGFGHHFDVHDVWRVCDHAVYGGHRYVHLLGQFAVGDVVEFEDTLSDVPSGRWVV